MFLPHLSLLPFVLAISAQAPGADSPHPILQGVKEVAFPGIPSDLVAWNPKARALIGAAWGQSHVPIAMALEAGEGRLLVTGHACFGKASLARADGLRFFENSLRWLGRERKNMEVLFNIGRGKLPLLTRLGWKARALRHSLPKALDPATHILLLDPTRLSKGDTQSLVDFVRQGGGLYLYGVGWGYVQIHPGRDLFQEAPFNRVLVPFGLAVGRNPVTRPPSGLYPSLSPAAAHPLTLPGALAHLRAPKPSPRSLQVSAASTLLRIARLLPKGHPSLADLFPALGPLLTRPLPPRAKAFLRLLQDLDPKLLAGAPGSDTPLSIPDFPGRMPKTPPIALRTHLDLREPGWISTGLYVPPGRIVEVQVLGKTPLPPLKLQIGAHSDRLWRKNRWRRDPEITRRFPLEGKTKALTRYGGLLYLLPQDKAWVSRKGAGVVELRTFGAVTAPRFVLGETSLEEWEKSLKSPAPWGEIEGRRIIFTMQTEKLRRLRDPRPALEFWDQVVDLYEKLDPQQPRPRKQRVVFDRQISAGALHSGYPIMGHLPHQDPVVDPTNYLLKEGKRKGRFWGLLHEIGHNYQRRDWTFGGTGEVTNNVFVLYANEKLLGASLEETIQQRHLREQKKAYLEAGAPFSLWKRHPFLALTTYIELIQTHGWAKLHKVYQGYRDHPLLRRSSDHAKIQAYVLRWSQAVGKDLSPFFRSWGWPLDERTIEACARVSAQGHKHRKFE